MHLYADKSSVYSTSRPKIFAGDKSLNMDVQDNQHDTSVRDCSLVILAQLNLRCFARRMLDYEQKFCTIKAT